MFSARAILGFALLLALGSQVFAQRELRRYEVIPKVWVTVTSLYQEVPPAGFLPVTVRVNNLSGRDYSGSLDARGLGNSALNYNSNLTLTVPDGDDRQFEVLVPLVNLGVEQNFGTANAMVIMSQVASLSTTYSTGGGDPRGPFVLLTDHAFGLQRSEIENAATASSPSVTPTSGRSGSQLQSSSLRTELLPEDSRAYFGLDEFWITPGDWRALRPPQQLAIYDWISRGGELTVWAPELVTDVSRDALANGGSATSKPEVIRYGTGRILTRTWDVAAGQIPLDGAKAYITSRYGVGVTRPDQYTDSKKALLARPYRDWDYVRKTPRVEVNLPILISAIVAFAVLVGPLNLFYFSKGAKRFRMFWITPVLSIATSLLVMVLIFLMDGLGASGKRNLLVVLGGSQNRASFFQEQITKSGVLMKTDFNVPDAILLPLEVVDSINFRNPKVLTQSSGHYSGDWFSSRAIAGLYLENTAAFRGNIEIVNKPEFATGAAPEIVSSLPQNLGYLEYVDGQGNIWFAERIATGVKTQLEKQPQRASLIPSKTAKIFGPVGQSSLEKLMGANNQFVAISDGTGSDLYFNTLDSIRWNQEEIVYVGELK